MQTFKMEFEGEKIDVNMANVKGSKFFEFQSRIGDKKIMLSIDGDGTEHWFEVSGGETDYAKKFGKTVECCDWFDYH